jgi:hypothetical protein
MSVLPEFAKLQVSIDYVAAIDKSSKMSLPEAYTGGIYEQAKKYIKKNKI